MKKFSSIFMQNLGNNWQVSQHRRHFLVVLTVSQHRRHLTKFIYRHSIFYGLPELIGFGFE